MSLFYGSILFLIGIFLGQYFTKIIHKLIKNGAEGIILGCTEIPLLIRQADVSVPVFDTTKIHSIAAFDFSTKYLQQQQQQ